MKTKFIAAIIAAMFPLGAIAQTAGAEFGSDAGAPPPGAQTYRSADAAGYQGSADVRSHARNTARSDTSIRGRLSGMFNRPPPEDRSIGAVGPVPDEGVALGLKFGYD